jgi:hypothetical protein
VSPWIGVAAVIAFLQIWHLAAPIDAIPFLVVSIAGMMATVMFCRRQLAAMCLQSASRPGVTALTFLFVAWLANRALNTQIYTDHGLYYMNGIRWATEYRIVPGLANLHHRLAFNNSNFLLHAMLELGEWRNYTAHIVNGFLAAMTAPIIVHGFSAVLSGKGRERQLGWFAVALAMIVAVSAVDRRISSAHPDFAAAMFVTVAAWRLLAIRLLDVESGPTLLRYNLLAIGMLAPAAVTIKLTVIFFAGFAAVALLVCLYQLANRNGSPPIRFVVMHLAFMLPWVVLVFVPWMVRGYILSGYPLFPATIAGAPVDWIYPAADAADLRRVIYAWSRAAYFNIDVGYQPGWGWVPHWLVQVIILRGPVEAVLPVLISMACLAAIVWRKRTPCAVGDEDGVGKYHGSVWPLGVAYAASIVAWFLTGPSPRMGSFALWGLAATLLVSASRFVSPDTIAHHRRIISACFVILFLLPMADEALRVEVRYRNNPKLPEFGKHAYLFYPLVIPTWDGNFPPLPQPAIVEATSRHGVVVYLGENDVEGAPTLVWDSPLPAAQYLNPDLQYRRDGDLQAGFRTAKSAAQ